MPSGRNNDENSGAASDQQKWRAYANEESYGRLGLMPTSFDAVLLP
jgi:hypothetical protein